jgi:hypothetical protein
VGIFTNADPQLETLIRQEADTRMLEAAMENGILEKADEEAEAFMRSFLEGLGFEEITFTDSTPPPVTPFVQEIPKGFVGTPVPGVTSVP